MPNTAERRTGTSPSPRREKKTLRLAVLDQSSHVDGVTGHEALSERAFGLVMSLISTAFALFPLLRGEALRLPFLTVGIILAFTGLVCPRALHWPKRFWVAVTSRIGAVVSFVLLAVIYFGVFTMVAFLFRLLRRDVLKRRFEPESATYWRKKEFLLPREERMKHVY